MDDRSLIDNIQGSPTIYERLAEVFDFELVEDADPGQGLILKPSKRVDVIGRDGTGGIFALCGERTQPHRSVLYASSEGEAGIIAHHLAEALQLLVYLPYWHDCLKFSGGGRLEDMKKAVSYLEHELRDDVPNIDVYRREVISALGLDTPHSPLETLYHTVASFQQEYVVESTDGEAFSSLFNTFVVNDNPMWN